METISALPSLFRRHLFLFTVVLLGADFVVPTKVYAQPKIGHTVTSAPTKDNAYNNDDSDEGEYFKPCCTCFYDSSEPRFLAACKTWLSQQTECRTKKLIEFNTTQNHCWSGSLCDYQQHIGDCGKGGVRVAIYGHGTTATCGPMAKQMVQLCLETNAKCADVVYNGCRVFGDLFEAMQSISEAQEQCPNLDLRITSNQCIAYSNNVTGCPVPTTESMCTITASAKCGTFCTFAKCPEVGSACAHSGESTCATSICTASSGDLKRMVCCYDKNPMEGVWVNEGDCDDCNGACCLNSNSCRDGAYPNTGWSKKVCTSNGYHWLAGETCASAEKTKACDQFRGACCRSDDEGYLKWCENSALQGQCKAMPPHTANATWHKGKSCSEIDCSPRLGACCSEYTDSGLKHCQVISRALCTSDNDRKGEWTEGKTCSEISCAPATGACCVENTCDGSRQCHENETQLSCQRRADTCHIPRFSPRAKCSETECSQVDCQGEGIPTDECNSCPCIRCKELICGSKEESCPHSCKETPLRDGVCCKMI